jgi:tRNA1(Val) A37 N6-methylase TrmN6
MDGNNYSSESMSESEMYHHAALYLLHQANGQDDDYNTQRKDIPVIIDKTIIIPPSSSSSSVSSSIIHNKLLPSWLPTNPGEQLCNLVGRWRIIQCVASHRWTTDDLVTAYIASITFTHQTKITLMNNNNTTTNTTATESFNNNNNDHRHDAPRKTVRYLDLGCGNASVLQMVSWYLLSQDSNETYYNKVQAVGVEARNEAVGLARRSLLFNLGQVNGRMPSSTTTYDTSSHNRIDHDVQVVHGDFRDLISISLKNNNDTSTKAEGHKQDDTPNNLEGIALQQYDIITGTPPYFRVGFTTSSSIDNSSVGDGSKHKNDTMNISAIIQQGGMPTSQQSAPARCEFRGGIEAYCQTASVLLHPHMGYSWFVKIG